MTRLILRGLVAAVGLWIAAHVVPGVHAETWKAYVGAGLLLGIVNAFVRPIVTLLTLPITLVTLGLFLLVVNGLMVLFVSWILRHLHGWHFHVGGIVNAVLVTIIVWFFSLVAHMLLGGERLRRR